MRISISPGLLLSLRRCYHYKPKDRHVLVQPPPDLINKDYILFKCEEPRILIKSLIASASLPLWSYLAYFAFNLKSKVVMPYAQDFKKGERNLWILNTVSNASTGVGVAFAGFGLGMTGYWFTRTTHTVRRIVLRKGGKYVTLVTYGLMGLGSKHSTVPISHCTAIRKTFLKDTKLFLRLKDHYVKYQMNIRSGIFLNKPLFDRTVGLSRQI